MSITLNVDICFSNPSWVDNDIQYYLDSNVEKFNNIEFHFSSVKRSHSDILVVYDIIRPEFIKGTYAISILIITEPQELDGKKLPLSYINSFDYLICFKPEFLMPLLQVRILEIVPPIIFHSGKLGHDEVIATRTICNEADIHVKSRTISMITSPKKYYRGHVARLKIMSQLISDNLLDINDVYGYNSRILDKRDGLLPYKFSLVFENSFNTGYISEKVADCFINLTVPVYIGSSKITDLFDPRSFIWMSPLNESYNTLCASFSQFNDEMYNSMYQYLQRARSIALRQTNVCFAIHSIIKDSMIDLTCLSHLSTYGLSKSTSRFGECLNSIRYKLNKLVPSMCEDKVLTNLYL